MSGNRNTTGTLNNVGSNGNLWTSTPASANAWNRNLNSTNTTVNRNTNSQANGFSVRCLLGLVSYSFMESEFDISLEDIFTAYYNCKKNKKSKLECIFFDLNYEKELIKLYEEIKESRYEVSPMSVFIVEKPVKREIFASAFRDRIIHHLIVMKIENLLEKEFIYDTYSCRKGKGTHFGIKRIDKFIRKATDNYKEEKYILKLDIKSYFMSIDKKILLRKLNKFIQKNYKNKDKEKLKYLIKKSIENDPTQNCIFKSKKTKWQNLPQSKSLFNAKENRGLPIGNYTNQLFANFYLNELDHYIKSKIKHYGRYVDDIILIGDYTIKNEIIIIREKLKTLKLELHPKKIYFQKTDKGVEYLGCLIKHYRKYITKRIKNNFIKAVKNSDTLKIKSYLGIMGHYNTYNLKNKYLNNKDDIGDNKYI